MKIITFIIFFVSVLSSQDIRYLDEVFDEVTKTEDVVYANAPDLPFIFFFEWNTVDIDLDMDIYEPSHKWIWTEDCYVTFHFHFDNCCFYDSGLCCPFFVSNNSSPSRYIPIKSFVLGLVSIAKSLITSERTLGILKSWLFEGLLCAKSGRSVTAKHSLA